MKEEKKLPDLTILARPPKVLIVAKQNKPGLRAARKLEKHLKEKIKDISFDPSTARRVKRLRKRGTSIKKFDGNMIITLGGDGTMLMTAHQAKVPILPVRIEGHGFLCTTTLKELLMNLDKLVRNDYRVINRLRIKSSKLRKGRVERYVDRILHRTYDLALNEIVFARRRPSKILVIEFKIDDTPFEFRGDGLMVSTPSGSTAYSASAGGAVIDPNLNAVIITPLYPFFSKIKPIVIPADKKIEVKIKEGDCAVIIDGHGGEYIKEESEFIIERGEPLRVINLFEKSFYERFKKEFIEAPVKRNKGS